MALSSDAGIVKNIDEPYSNTIVASICVDHGLTEHSLKTARSTEQSCLRCYSFVDEITSKIIADFSEGRVYYVQ